VYYPHVGEPSDFPEIAQRECAKYGQISSFQGSGAADFGRKTETYSCAPQ
jgi:hypothetical protein